MLFDATLTQSESTSNEDFCLQDSEEKSILEKKIILKKKILQKEPNITPLIERIPIIRK